MFSVTDITHVRISRYAWSQLRQADYIANEILHHFGHSKRISQLSVVLVTVHFDQDPTNRVPVVPGSNIRPVYIPWKMGLEIAAVSGMSREWNTLAGTCRD